MRVIGVREFIRDYRPESNSYDPIDRSFVHDGIAYGYKPVGEEVQLVTLLVPMRIVWTASWDGSLRPGYHTAGREFHVITLVRHDDEDIVVDLT